MQLLDYRPPKGKDPLLEDPVRSSVVLSPNGETIWQDICLLNQKTGATWTDAETLEVEAQILVIIFLYLAGINKLISYSDVDSTTSLP